MYQNEPFKIFVVEDDPTYLKFLQYVLGLNPDFDIKIYSTGQEFLDHLHENPSLVTLDYSLPDFSGEEILKQIKIYNPDINVVIISSQEKIGTAVDLLKQGAYDYIVKDQETKDRLLNTINNARKHTVLIKEINNLKEEISKKYQYNKSIIGTSKPIKEVFELIDKAVTNKITVSVNGETGTGKELVAKAIHYNSERKKQKFVAVNLSAIPKELVESELFGHEKGAFTGADNRRIGKFEEADKGTLFLDEIAEMDISLQSKLLRALQEFEITRIGSNDLIKVDLRIIVATHKELSREVKEGRFREDLYYRLLGLPIDVPPLRDRGNDIVLIAKHFLVSFCKENNMELKRISKSAQEKLLTYHYPGNIRELKSIIDLAAVLSNQNEINAEDISFSAPIEDGLLSDKEMTLKEYDYKIIKHFLSKYDNDVDRVAELLDIGRSSIYRYLQDMKSNNK